MPATKVEYPRFNYIAEPYQSRYGDTVAQMLGLQGQRRAALELAQGEATARMWENIGQSIGGAVQGYQRQRESDRVLAMQEADRSALAEYRNAQTQQAQAKGQADQAAAQRTEEFRTLLRNGKGRDVVLQQLEGDPDLYKQATGHFDAIDQEHNRFLGGIAARIREYGDDPTAASAAISDLIGKGYDREQMSGLLDRIEQDPSTIPQMVDAFLQQSPDPAHKALISKAKDPIKLNENERLIDPETNKELVSAVPEPAKPLSPIELNEGATLVDPQTGNVIARGNPKREAGGGDKEPLMAVMGPDGNPVYVPRSEARGMRPASNREQGRAVTAGDAGRLAELDTSLDDVDVLSVVIQGVEGATGNLAAFQASLPNWATNMVGGWGSEAKSKQAVIDRVRQVIGKALEGGVLRKEDETKYAKILPVVSDHPEVVATKLAGLKSAITQRKERELDAREDAGYDVGRFRQRMNSMTGQRRIDTPAPPPGGGMVPMIAPDGRQLMVPQGDVERLKGLGAKVAG
jgi:hypothetical protein